MRLWSSLRRGGRVAADSWAERVETRDEAAGQGYVFDHPLPVSCPELLRTFVVPKYFARDRLLTGAPVDDGQVPPALFVQCGNAQPTGHGSAAQRTGP
jgi:hypothetical protein